MPDSKNSPSDDGAGETHKRNLPSWMSSREKKSKNNGKKPNDGNGEIEESNKKSSAPSSSNNNFSKLLDGVVFVLSGFVNPERSTLRSQALEMGAEYKTDWNSDCTLLVCAFPNTPKFRQVQADCGTIVSKEWIAKCYREKKLVDIDPYLMHPGKPWRRSSDTQVTCQEEKGFPAGKLYKQAEEGSQSKRKATPSKNKALDPAKESFSPSEVKRWAVDDFNKTISWLESQDEKPEPSELKRIAAQGILTCLQDTIDSLEQKQDVCQVTDQWNFIPRVVEELAKLEGNESASPSTEELLRKAMAYKKLYQEELSRLDGESSSKNKNPKIDRRERGNMDGTKAISSGEVGYDSDETIEMTEEEIDHAYKNVSSKICK